MLIDPGVSDLWALAKDVITIVLIPFAVNLTKSLNEIKKELYTVSVVLMGADGKNGIRSRVIKMEDSVATIKLALARKGIHLREDPYENTEDDNK